MRSPTSSDIPAEAYRKGVAALDDFGRAARCYEALVDTAQVHLRDGRWEDASKVIARATRASTGATHAAQRVNALLRLLEAPDAVHHGARSSDLLARARVMRSLSAAIAGASVRLAALCAVRRAAARGALASNGVGNGPQPGTRAAGGARRAYAAPTPQVSLAINTSR